MSEITKELAEIVVPATESQKASIVSALQGDSSQMIVRKMAHEIDRLKSAIDGSGGWKDENGKLKEAIGLLRSSAGVAFSHWDNDQDSKVGKWLAALSGDLPLYSKAVTDALALADGE